MKAAKRSRLYDLALSGIWIQWFIACSIWTWFRHENGVLAALLLCCIPLEVRFARRAWRRGGAS